MGDDATKKRALVLIEDLKRGERISTVEHEALYAALKPRPGKRASKEDGEPDWTTPDGFDKEAITRWVITACERTGLSQNELCALAGIETGYFRRYFAGMTQSLSTKHLHEIVLVLQDRRNRAVVAVAEANFVRHPGLSVARLRSVAKLTQQQLADAVGIQQIRVSKIERGENEMTDDEVERFAAALGADPKLLLKGRDLSQDPD